MIQPRYAVSENSTILSSFDEDLVDYAAGGATGIGISEAKLPAGRDDESLVKLRSSGLVATVCLPACLSVLPLPPFAGPEDPDERVELLCASVRRLATFDPEVVVCLTGPAGARDPKEARGIVVEGLREVARCGDAVGVRVALEPIHASARDAFTIVDNLPDTVDLIDEIGLRLGIVLDTWHLWDTPDVLHHIREHARRVSAVHVADWRDPTRGWDDRALPGEGITDLPSMLGALEEGGFDGWYELEIFSNEAYPDSLLQLDPVDLVARGRDGFMRAWEARGAL